MRIRILITRILDAVEISTPTSSAMSFKIMASGVGCRHLEIVLLNRTMAFITLSMVLSVA